MEKNAFKTLSAKKRMTCQFSILLLIFSLMITSSVAWLVTNRQTDADDVGISLEVDDTVAIYRAYIYDFNAGEDGKGAGVNKIGDKEVDVTNLNLNQYDTVFRAKNIYTTAFAQINLLGRESMPESGTLHITIECETEGIDPQKKEYTSNIARFTAFIYPDDDGDPTTPPPDVLLSDDIEDDAEADALYELINTEDRYKEVEAYRGNSASSKTFATIKGEEGSYTCDKASSITISVNYTTNDWYQVVKNGISEKHLNVYLYITYDVQLIEYYFEGFDDELLNLDYEGIPFANDLKKITVSYDK